MAKSPYDALEAKDSTGQYQAVVDTPKDSRHKYKYDETLHLFRLNSILPAGMSFPYDFGYIPGTRGEDGDPIDIIILMEEPTFTGCVVQVRLIGVIEAEQAEDGKVERNDRLVGVATESRDDQDLKSLKDVNSNLMNELEQFFVAYNKIKGKEFRLIDARGPGAAEKLIEKSIETRSQK